MPSPDQYQVLGCLPGEGPPGLGFVSFLDLSGASFLSTRSKDPAEGSAVSTSAITQRMCLGCPQSLLGNNTKKKQFLVNAAATQSRQNQIFSNVRNHASNLFLFASCSFCISFCYLHHLFSPFDKIFIEFSNIPMLLAETIIYCHLECGSVGLCREGLCAAGPAPAFVELR